MRSVSIGATGHVQGRKAQRVLLLLAEGGGVVVARTESKRVVSMFIASKKHRQFGRMPCS